MDVQIVKKLDCTDKIIKSSPKFTTATKTGVEASTDEFNSPPGRGFPIRKRRLENEEESDQLADLTTKKRMKEELESPGITHRSQGDWIRYLDKNFMEVICGGKLLTIFGRVLIMFSRYGRKFESSN